MKLDSITRVTAFSLPVPRLRVFRRSVHIPLDGKLSYLIINYVQIAKHFIFASEIGVNISCYICIKNLIAFIMRMVKPPTCMRYLEMLWGADTNRVWTYFCSNAMTRAATFYALSLYSQMHLQCTVSWSVTSDTKSATTSVFCCLNFHKRSPRMSVTFTRDSLIAKLHWPFP